METQNVIRTLFEYTSKGYEEANKNATELLGKVAALRIQKKELEKIQKEDIATVDALNSKWQELNKTMGEGTPKEVREYFAQLPKLIDAATAAQAKATAQKQANTKAQETENKKVKEATELQTTYKKVLDELDKGMKNAEMSTDALTKAKKYLNAEMSKKIPGSEDYIKLSKEMAQVTKASNDIYAAQKRQIKQEGVHSNSIEAMRLKVAALNAEWIKMDRSTPEFTALATQLKAAADELKSAEAEVGIFSRNVGNYKSTFDGLGMSIAQLTREAPAFAHSMTTGFMAISNNIPMLFDEVKKLRLENSALNAEGIKTPPIWKSLVKSFLSWNTALSLGIVLLTVYGKDVVEWAASLLKAEKALTDLELAQRRVNEAMAQGRQDAQKELVPLRLLYEATQDTTLSIERRTAAAKKLQETYPDTFSKFNTEKILAGELQTAYDDLTKSILARAEAAAAEQMVTEREVTRLKVAELATTKYFDEYKRIMAEIDSLDAKTKANPGLTSFYIQRGMQFNADLDNINRKALKSIKKADEELFNTIKSSGKPIFGYYEGLRTENEKLTKDVVNRLADFSTKNKDIVTTQTQLNDAYIKAIQERLQAEEDVGNATVNLQNAKTADERKTTEDGLVFYKKILDNRIAAEEEAKSKSKKLTQEQYDELELAQYVHLNNLAKLQADADKKREDAENEKQKTVTDGYLKASNDYRTAQAVLIEAQKRGNTEEIALYERLLKQKEDALTKYNADEVQLNEEQRLAEEMAAYDHQQKVIIDYIALQQQLADLQNQYQEAQTQSEQEAIQKQINLVNAKVATQVQALQTLGVNIAGINVEVEQSIDTTQQYLSDRLQQSLQTIEQFSGRSKNNFFKLATSITGLVAKAFDFKKATAGMDKTTKEFKKMKGEFTVGMAEIGAAVALNGLNAATDIINQNIEAEKQAIDEMYAYQEKRAQESYDQQSRELKFALDDKQISEAKYRLEQMKLDDKKAEEDKKREKDKANAQYDLELKQFRVNQAKDAISAMIATSLGIINAVAQMPLTGGMPFAAIVTAMGAAQVATIYAQKPPQKPKFEKGGGIRFEPIDGPSHNNGGVPIRFGNRVVAEAEGDEGALIISKRAMRNSYMRQLLAFVESVGAGISGTQSDPSKFAEGGYLSYDEDFFMPARNSLKITKRKKRSIRINGKKVKLKPYGFNADAAIDDYAEKIAIPQWNAYIDRERARLANREAEINEAINAGISNNETLKNMGVTDITSFNKLQADKEKELDTVQKQIKVYEEAANARIDALKTELQYEQKLADFEKQRKDAASELATTTEEFNTRVLGELRETGQITEEEYLSMLDQIKYGYGVKTTDIINLKKKEVEAIKKLINEERDAELNAAKDTAKYREDALAQMRSEWEENYNAITQQIIDDAESASDAISQLTGTDLERFNQILHIQQEIKKMEEDYQKNETLLTDGVIQSREERTALVVEQKRIKEQLALKEQEAEEAKAAFEAERQKNMESAMKAYETENFADLLAQIKELGTDLQAEGNKWTLDKELAAELDAELQAINATYDEQIAKQDSIIDGLQAEIDAAQLLHDKKVAYIKEEEEALKATFEEQKAAIDTWLANATSGLRTEAAELSQFVAALKVAGIEAGLTEYEKAMEALNKNIDALQSTGGKKYETGGAVEIGSGLYQVTGPSHSQGGVPIRVGNTQIAEVEGIEKMFAVNKMAANDPEMMAVLAKASNINARYTGVPLIESGSGDGFALDYDLLAAKIGAQINARPTKTYVTYRDVKTAYDITQMHKKSSLMG